MTQISQNLFDRQIRHSPSFVGDILDIEGGLCSEFGARLSNAILLHLLAGFSQELAGRVYGVSQASISRAIDRLYGPKLNHVLKTSREGTQGS